jgi:hypothetical protein
MHVLRRVDRRRFRMDFLVNAQRACAYDDEIRGLGARIIRGPDPRRPWRYFLRLERPLREHGPFDVVHRHLSHFSDLVLRAARRLEMERRSDRLGLRSVFTGSRPDMPRLMLGAMDAFVFPSLFEGLGLVLVEAQAAGSPS